MIIKVPGYRLLADKLKKDSLVKRMKTKIKYKSKSEKKNDILNIKI
jgi:hypothetical protein